MTLQQGLAFAVVLGMMALFVWGRFRYDLVGSRPFCRRCWSASFPPRRRSAVSATTSSLSSLRRSWSAQRSPAPASWRWLLGRIGPYLASARMVIVVLVAAVTILSAFVKNIGALAMLMPVAFQLARRTNTSPSYMLMPMAFGSLLGGTMTLIGTSPNVIVSRMRDELEGEPFAMFDFTPVGASIAIVGVVFLAFGYKLLPAGRKGTASLDTAFNIKGYVTEATVPADSSLVGKTVADLEKMGEGEVEVSTIIRERFRRYTPSPSWAIEPEDVLLARRRAGGSRADRRAGQAAPQRGRGQPGGTKTSSENFGVMEAVVTREFAARRTHATGCASRRALPGRPARSEPQRRTADPSPPHDQVRARRRRRAAGRPDADARHARGAALPAARRAWREARRAAGAVSCRSSCWRRRCCSWRCKLCPWRSASSAPG